MFWESRWILFECGNIPAISIFRGRWPYMGSYCARDRRPQAPLLIATLVFLLMVTLFLPQCGGDSDSDVYEEGHNIDRMLQEVSTVYNFGVANQTRNLSPQYIEKCDIYKTMQELMNQDQLQTLRLLPRPLINGPALDVEVQVFINHIFNIDQVRFMYRMTGYLRILWSDERFDSPLYNESCSREFIDVTALKSRLWTPDIYLTNSVKTTYRDESLQLAPGGQFFWTRNFNSEISCPMDLVDLPFDSQSCPFTLMSYSYPARKLRLRWRDGVAVQHANTLKLAEWILLNFTDDTGLNYDFYEPWSRVTLYTNLRRRENYYVVQVMIPVGLFNLVSYSSFWVDAKALPARTAFVLLPLLIVVNQLNHVSSGLPRIAYMYWLRDFLMTSLALSTVCCLEYTTVIVLLRRSNNKKVANVPPSTMDDFKRLKNRKTARRLKEHFLMFDQECARTMKRHLPRSRSAGFTAANNNGTIGEDQEAHQEAHKEEADDFCMYINPAAEETEDGTPPGAWGDQLNASTEELTMNQVLQLLPTWTRCFDKRNVYHTARAFWHQNNDTHGYIHINQVSTACQYENPHFTPAMKVALENAFVNHRNMREDGLVPLDMFLWKALIGLEHPVKEASLPVVWAGFMFLAKGWKVFFSEEVLRTATYRSSLPGYFFLDILARWTFPMFWLMGYLLMYYKIPYELRKIAFKEQ